MKYKIKLFLIILFVLFAALNSSASSSFKDYRFLNSINIKIPNNWIVINNNLMKQIDTNTEIMTGNDQSNNNILLAANWYPGNDRSNASASMRLSIRYEENSTTQKDLEDITREEIIYLDAKVRKILYDEAKKMNLFISRYYQSEVRKINGKYCLYNKYIMDNKIQELYTYYLGNKRIKLMTTYDASKSDYLESTINVISNSLIIK